MLVSCGGNESITKKALRIEQIGVDRFGRKHCKNLIIQNEEGKELDHARLYCNPSTGCNVHLFESTEAFTLIDCNGHWFSVSKKTGKIDNLGWRWLNDYPDNLIGVFHREEKDMHYELKAKTETSLKEVYKYMDPK